MPDARIAQENVPLPAFAKTAALAAVGGQEALLRQVAEVFLMHHTAVCRQLDQALAALIQDLHDRGMVELVEESTLPACEVPRLAAATVRLYRLAPGDVIGAGTPIADLQLPEWGSAQTEYLSVKKLGKPELTAAARQRLAGPGRGLARLSLEMGLTGVLATQLWHHLYLDGSLCDLPSKVAKP